MRVTCVLSFAIDVEKNAASTKMSIVANVHEFAANVRRNAKVCKKQSRVHLPVNNRFYGVLAMFFV